MCHEMFLRLGLLTFLEYFHVESAVGLTNIEKSVAVSSLHKVFLNLKTVCHRFIHKNNFHVLLYKEKLSYPQ